jgi:hypothetical protein
LVELRSGADLFFFYSDNNIAFLKTVSFGWTACHYSSNDDVSGQRLRIESQPRPPGAASDLPILLQFLGVL